MPMLTHPGTAITAAWGLKLSHSISHKGGHPGREGGPSQVTGRVRGGQCSRIGYGQGLTSVPSLPSLQPKPTSCCS